MTSTTLMSNQAKYQCHWHFVRYCPSGEPLSQPLAIQNSIRPYPDCCSCMWRQWWLTCVLWQGIFSQCFLAYPILDIISQLWLLFFWRQHTSNLNNDGAFSICMSSLASPCLLLFFIWLLLNARKARPQYIIYYILITYVATYEACSS